MTHLGEQPSTDPVAYRFAERASALGLSLDRRMTHGDLTLDLDRYEVCRGDTVIELTPTQLELLAVFFAAPDRIWSRSALNTLLGPGYDTSRRVDVHITRLRRSLGANLFRVVPGHGWILRAARAES